MQLKNSPLIGEITIACTLGYRDFRFADDDWRAGRPALATWFESIMRRESLQQTIPDWHVEENWSWYRNTAAAEMKQRLK